MKKYVIWSVAVQLLMWHPLTGAPNLNKILQKVEEAIESAKTLRIQFEETYIWEMTNEESRVSGELILQGDKRFRVTMDDQILVSDGSTLWTYSQDANRVLIDHLISEDNSLLPRQILFKYTGNYRSILLEDEPIAENFCYVVEFTDEEGAEYFPVVRVWIDQKSWMPRQVLQTDLSGNKMKYLLKDVQVNPDIDPVQFDYQIPEDAEVIDMR